LCFCLPFTERTLLGAKSYYFLYIGLGLVFVMYGLTIRSIFFFLQHTRREPVYVWIAFLLWSVFICSVLAVFAIPPAHELPRIGESFEHSLRRRSNINLADNRILIGCDSGRGHWHLLQFHKHYLCFGRWWAFSFAYSASTNVFKFTRLVCQKTR